MDSFNPARRDLLKFGGIGLAAAAATLPAYAATKPSRAANSGIFDVRHYGVAYLVAWLPFLALVGGAAVMRRRIQPRAPEWNDS